MQKRQTWPMDIDAMCVGSLAGSGPAAGYFSCLPKKSNPKKGTPLHHPFGAKPRLNRAIGAAAQLALRAQTVLAEFPRRLDPVEVAQKGETGVLR